VTRTVALPKPAGPTHDCKALLAKGYPRDQVTQYWENLGRPADMDDDANGYPCETVYGRAFPSALVGCKIRSFGDFDLEFEVLPAVSSYGGTAAVTFYERDAGITFPTTAVVTVAPFGSMANWHSVPPTGMGASAEPDSCTAVAHG
jgi:hypothetical protein